jgi:hypothetical protein
VHLERLVLSTDLTVADCAERLRATTSPGVAWLRPSGLPVRGFVKPRHFYFGRGAPTRIPLRTWMAGRLRDAGDRTVIEVSIGPNPVGGALLLLFGCLLLSTALVATAIAIATSSWRAVPISWAVVLGFATLFFGIPAAVHEDERAFLLEHLRRTVHARFESRG